MVSTQTGRLIEHGYFFFFDLVLNLLHITRHLLSANKQAVWVLLKQKHNYVPSLLEILSSTGCPVSHACKA